MLTHFLIVIGYAVAAASLFGWHRAIRSVEFWRNTQAETDAKLSWAEDGYNRLADNAARAFMERNEAHRELETLRRVNADLLAFKQKRNQSVKQRAQSARRDDVREAA